MTGFWMEPGRDYFEQAMDELMLGPVDLEVVKNGVFSLPVGGYPVLDSVYRRAWELREQDEA